MAPQGGSLIARSWLFAPGDSEKKIEKAAGCAADAVILDLEDAVASDQKAKARALVAAFLLADPRRRDRLWVRINPIQGPFGLDDLVAVIPGRPAGIVLPKPRGRSDADLLDAYLTALEAAAGVPTGATKVKLLVTEEPTSLLALNGYVGTPRMVAMSWGAEDLATALGASDNRGGFNGYDFTYELARSLCLIGAAAAGVAAIETIHGDFRDEAGLRARAANVRRQGYSGMQAIHPAQIEIINEAFTPNADEIQAAQEIVDAFAAHPGAGTIGHKGAMLDRPHLVRAQALLALAQRK